MCGRGAAAKLAVELADAVEAFLKGRKGVDLFELMDCLLSDLKSSLCCCCCCSCCCSNTGEDEVGGEALVLRRVAGNEAKYLAMSEKFSFGWGGGGAGSALIS